MLKRIIHVHSFSDSEIDAAMSDLVADRAPAASQSLIVRFPISVPENAVHNGLLKSKKKFRALPRTVSSADDSISPSVLRATTLIRPLSTNRKAVNRTTLHDWSSVLVAVVIATVFDICNSMLSRYLTQSIQIVKVVYEHQQWQKIY